MQKNYIFYFIFLFLGFTIKTYAQTFNPVLAAQLQQKLDSITASSPIKGISVCVYKEGQGFWQGVSGISTTGLPITPDMLFGIGSNTKLFTAVSLLKLVENQTISLNDSVSKWLPPIANVNPTITIKQLLNHTSGLADYNDIVGYPDSILTNPNRFFQPNELLTWIGAPLSSPGTSFSYCNSNYLLAGLILQAASSQQLPTFIRSQILTPLSLDSTYFDVYESPIGIAAQPWQNGININNQPRVSLNSAAWAAGAMSSNSFEMANWYKSLLIDRQVLDSATFAMMTDFQPVNGYGLGIAQQNLGGVTLWAHGGSIRGYISRMVFEPTQKIVISILINTNPANPTPFTDVLLQTLMNQTTGIENPIASPKEIHLFPNPSKDKIHLQNLSASTHYQILNFLGQVIQKGETNGSIDLQNIEKGIYFLQLKHHSQDKMIKFVKW